MILDPVARFSGTEADYGLHDEFSSCTFADDDSGEGGTQVEASSTERYCCYLLVSESTDKRARNRTYIGFTTDPSRRLRQHNGELKGAGAHRTRAFRPWRLLIFVEGFRSQVQALQFEWQWQHPRNSRTQRQHQAGLGSETSIKQPYGIAGRLQVLARLLAMRPWCCIALRVVVPDRHRTSDQQKPRIVSERWLAALPLSVRILRDVSVVEAVAKQPDGIGSLHRRRDLSTLCCVCFTREQFVEKGRRKRYPQATGYCLHCTASFHLQCIVQYACAERLLPESVHCARCQQLIAWADVLRSVDLATAPSTRLGAELGERPSPSTSASVFSVD
jgi:predicted GIY-YIG superfamily endonuclease